MPLTAILPKTWASDVTQEIGQFENWETWSVNNVCSPSCGGVCGPSGPFPVDNQRSDQKLTPGDQIDLFSANRSRIDGKYMEHPNSGRLGAFRGDRHIPGGKTCDLGDLAPRLPIV